MLQAMGVERVLSAAIQNDDFVIGKAEVFNADGARVVRIVPIFRWCIGFGLLVDVGPHFGKPIELSIVSGVLDDLVSCHLDVE